MRVVIEFKTQCRNNKERKIEEVKRKRGAHVWIMTCNGTHKENFEESGSEREREKERERERERLRMKLETIDLTVQLTGRVDNGDRRFRE